MGDLFVAFAAAAAAAAAVGVAAVMAADEMAFAHKLTSPEMLALHVGCRKVAEEPEEVEEKQNVSEGTVKEVYQVANSALY